MQVVVSGTFRLPDLTLPEARDSMARIIAASRAEEGCIEYAFGLDVAERGLVRVYEEWKSAEVLAEHFASAHMQTWREERERLGMTERNITIRIMGEVVTI